VSVRGPEEPTGDVPGAEHGEVPSGGAEAVPTAGAGEWTERSPVPPSPPQTMIPARARRRSSVERVSMRILATGGIIGIAVALGAILVAQDVAGWIVGLVIGLTSVVLAAVLWSSRQL
jgi:hypothetical protein